MEKNLLIKNAYIDDFLIKEIIAINKKQSEEEITFESYKKRFNKNNIIYCLYDNNKMIGYTILEKIDEYRYNEIKGNSCTNNLNTNLKYIYLSSIVILKDYQSKGNGTFLLDKIFREIKAHFIAISISKEGFNLLNKKMQLINKASDEIGIFILNNS